MRCYRAASSLLNAENKERELSQSRSFPRLCIWVIVDSVLLPTQSPPYYTVDKRRYDVTITVNGVAQRRPSDIYNWLRHFDSYWSADDKHGILDNAQLTSLLAYLDLQNDIQYSSAQAEQGSSGVGQEVLFESF